MSENICKCPASTTFGRPFTRQAPLPCFQKGRALAVRPSILSTVFSLWNLSLPSIVTCAAVRTGFMKAGPEHSRAPALSTDSLRCPGAPCPFFHGQAEVRPLLTIQGAGLPETEPPLRMESGAACFGFPTTLADRQVAPALSSNSGFINAINASFIPDTLFNLELSALLLLRQFLIHLHQCCYAVSLGHLRGETVGFHHSPVVGRMGLLQFDRHGQGVIKCGQ